MRAAPVTTLIAVVVATLASTSAATPARSPSPFDVVVATNHPFMWSGTTSVAGSAYLGFGTHHAIRVNVARYRPGLTDGIATIPAAVSGEDDGDAPELGGHTTDVGVSYLYFVDERWRHLFIEVGAMRREIHTTSEGEYQSPEVDNKDATGYAARLHVGWSWLFSNHVFIAAAVGLSGGRYIGIEHTEESAWDPMSPASNTSYNHIELAPEGYLRFGLRFGI